MEDVLIRFRLIGDEARALLRLSMEELRKPRDQVRFILRGELQRRGLLQEVDGGDQPDSERSLPLAASDSEGFEPHEEFVRQDIGGRNPHLCHELESDT